MSKDIAVTTVRKWHLSVCHDLCLPVIPIIVKQYGGNGRAGLFLGERTQDPTYFIGGDFDGLFLGGTVGGKESVECSVTIFVDAAGTETGYLYTLAHELRHAWQFLNRVPATEEDCNDYAERFLRRFSAPDCGIYDGLVDEREYAARAALAASKHRRICTVLGFLFSVILAIGGAACLNYTPPIGGAAGMYRPDQVDEIAAATHTARIFGLILLIPLAIFALVYLASSFGMIRKSFPKLSKQFRKLSNKTSTNQSQVAYSMQIKNHPSNGKEGRWEVCGCVVNARSAQEAIDKVAAAGRLDRENPVPRYRGSKR